MVSSPMKFPKTKEAGVASGVHWLFVLALGSSNWPAALAIAEYVDITAIEQDLRDEDENDSILDGIKTKNMPKKLRAMCQAAVAKADVLLRGRANVASTKLQPVVGASANPLLSGDEDYVTQQPSPKKKKKVVTKGGANHRKKDYNQALMAPCTCNDPACMGCDYCATQCCFPCRYGEALQDVTSIPWCFGCCAWNCAVSVASSAVPPIAAPWVAPFVLAEAVVGVAAANALAAVGLPTTLPVAYVAANATVGLAAVGCAFGPPLLLCHVRSELNSKYRIEENMATTVCLSLPCCAPCVVCSLAQMVNQVRFEQRLKVEVGKSR